MGNPKGVGKRRERIIIQQLSDTQDSFGDPTSAPTVIATKWASYIPLKGEELVRANQTAAFADGRFELAYVPGIKAKMQIVMKGETYDILYPQDVENRHTDLEILTRKVT